MSKFVLLLAILCLSMCSSMAVFAEQVTAGSPAPDFELRDQYGNLHSIEDYRGQWVALYFYPRDDTPGCTAEACEFRDNIFAFRRVNCEVIGVSLDDATSHRSFAEKYALPFPLLADIHGTTAAAYGVKTKMLGMTVARRQTFLIDPEGNIAKHFAEVDPASHPAEVLEELEKHTGRSGR